MNPSYKVNLRTTGEPVCVAMFAAEGDARSYAIDVAKRPAANGVSITRKNRVIWQDERSADYSAEAAGY